MDTKVKRRPNAAAQARMVSVVRIRLDSRKSPRPSKGIFCDGISEFESYDLIFERLRQQDRGKPDRESVRLK